MWRCHERGEREVKEKERERKRERVIFDRDLDRAGQSAPCFSRHFNLVSATSKPAREQRESSDRDREEEGLGRRGGDE